MKTKYFFQTSELKKSNKKKKKKRQKKQWEFEQCFVPLGCRERVTSAQDKEGPSPFYLFIYLYFLFFQLYYRVWVCLFQSHQHASSTFQENTAPVMVVFACEHATVVALRLLLSFMQLTVKRTVTPSDKQIHDVTVDYRQVGNTAHTLPQYKAS